MWVTIANSNLCRIYQFEKQPTTITLVKEIQHPENRPRSGEYLTSDKPGHFQAGDAHGSYSPHTDPKATEIDHFSREVAQTLNQGRNQQAYKNLILITPSHMQGLLLKHLDKHVKDMIKTEIQKDVMHLSQDELLRFLKEHIF